MMKHNLIITTALLFIFVATELSGQVIVPAGGGNATGAGGSASYTIGQTMVAGSDESKSVAQGFQQPYEIILVGINEMTGIKLECKLFPNPATDYIKLKLENYEGGELTVVLFDMGGTMLLNSKLESDELMIPMQGRKPGTYFLKLTDGKLDLRIFKIIKK